MDTECINVNDNIKHMLYAFVKSDDAHTGYIKVGQTDRAVDVRIREQQATDYKSNIKVWSHAGYDQNGNIITDTMVHADLENRLKVRRMRDEDTGRLTEWFECDLDMVKRSFRYLYTNGKSEDNRDSLSLRKPQMEARDKMLDVLVNKNNDTFLLAACPRYGKSVTTLSALLAMGAKRVLLVSNYPAVMTSWKEDIRKFSQFDGVGYRHRLGSGKEDEVFHAERGMIVDMISLQNLKGTDADGSWKDNNTDILNTRYDVFVSDESHYGFDTERTDAVLRQLKFDKLIGVTGTADMILEKGTMLGRPVDESNCYIHTYLDMRKAATAKHPCIELNMFYMDVAARVNMMYAQGSALNLHFSAAAIFEIAGSGNDARFAHPGDVDYLIDKFLVPRILEHGKSCMIFMNGRKECTLMERELNKRVLLNNSKVINVSTSDLDEDQVGCGANAQKVVDQFNSSHYNNRIVLSCGKLTTGVTLPYIDVIFHLHSSESYAKYIQATYRCLTGDGPNKHGREAEKMEAFVYDMEPGRAINMIMAEQTRTDDPAKGRDKATIKRDIAPIANYIHFSTVYDNGEVTRMEVADIQSALDAYRDARIRNVKLITAIRSVFTEATLLDFGMELCEDLLHGVKGVSRNAVLSLFNNLPTAKAKRNSPLPVPRATPAQKKVHDDTMQKLIEGLSLLSDGMLNLSLTLSADKYLSVYELLDQYPGEVTKVLQQINDRFDAKRMRKMLNKGGVNMVNAIDGAIRRKFAEMVDTCKSECERVGFIAHKGNRIVSMSDAIREHMMFGLHDGETVVTIAHVTENKITGVDLVFEMYKRYNNLSITVFADATSAMILKKLERNGNKNMINVIETDNIPAEVEKWATIDHGPYVVVANPPYNIATSNGKSKKVYDKICLDLLKNAKKATVIIPARFAVQPGCQELRDKLLPGLKSLQFFSDGAKVFNGAIDSAIGVCVFNWDSKYTGNTDMFVDGEFNHARHFNSGDRFYPYEEQSAVARKIQNVMDKSLLDFLIHNPKDFVANTFYGCMNQLASGSDSLDAKMRHPSSVVKPGEVVSYARHAWEFGTEQEAQNFYDFARSKFVAFALTLVIMDRNLTKSNLAEIPYMDFTQHWDDEKLYKHFKLTKQEIARIEEVVRD